MPPVAVHAHLPSTQGPLRGCCPKCSHTLLFPTGVDSRSCPSCNIAVPRPVDGDEENQLPAKRSSCPAVLMAALRDDEKPATKQVFSKETAGANGKGSPSKVSHVHRTSSLRPRPQRPFFWWLLCLLLVLSGAAQFLLASDVVRVPLWAASACLYALEMVCLIGITAQLSGKTQLGPFSEKSLIEKGATGSSAQLDLLDKLTRLALVVCGASVSDCAAVIRGLSSEDCSALQQITVRMLKDLDDRTLLAGALPAAARRAATAPDQIEASSRQPRHSATEKTSLSDSSVSEDSLGYKPPGSHSSRSPDRTDNSEEKTTPKLQQKKVEKTPSDPNSEAFFRRSITGSSLQSQETRRTQSNDEITAPASGPNIGALTSSDEERHPPPVLEVSANLRRQDSTNSNNSYKRKMRNAKRNSNDPTKQFLQHSDTRMSQGSRKSALSRQNTNTHQGNLGRSDTGGTRNSLPVLKHSDTNISLTSFTAFNQENRRFVVPPPIQQGVPLEIQPEPPDERAGSQSLPVGAWASRAQARHGSVISGASTAVRLIQEAADPKHAKAVGNLVWCMDGTAQNCENKEAIQTQAQRLFQRYEEKYSGKFQTGVTSLTDDTIPTEALLDIAFRDLGEDVPSFGSHQRDSSKMVRSAHPTSKDSEAEVDAALARLQRALGKSVAVVTNDQVPTMDSPPAVEHLPTASTTRDADREVASVMQHAHIETSEKDFEKVQSLQLARIAAREKMEAEHEHWVTRQREKGTKQQVTTKLSSKYATFGGIPANQQREEEEEEDTQSAQLARVRAREDHEDAIQRVQEAIHKKASSKDSSPPPVKKASPPLVPAKMSPIERQPVKSPKSTPSSDRDVPQLAAPEDPKPKVDAKARYEARKARKQQLKQQAAMNCTVTYGELIRNSHEQHLDQQPKLGKDLPKSESGFVSLYEKSPSSSSSLRYEPSQFDFKMEEESQNEDPSMSSGARRDKSPSASSAPRREKSPEIVDILPSPAAATVTARKEQPLEENNSYRSVGMADPDAARRYEERQKRKREAREQVQLRMTYGDIIRASHEQTLPPQLHPTAGTPRFGDSNYNPTPSPSFFPNLPAINQEAETFSQASESQWQV